MHVIAHTNAPMHWPWSSEQLTEWHGFQNYNSSQVLEGSTDKILQIWHHFMEVKYLVLAKLPSPWRPARRNFRCFKNAGHTEALWKLPEGSNFLFCAKICNNRKLESERNEMGSPLTGSSVVPADDNRVAADFSAALLAARFSITI